MLGIILQGRYQLIQFLGTGGFCQTYIAQDISQPQPSVCVVKHLNPIRNHPTSLITRRQLFTREAEALKKLSHHDQVPQLLAHFEEDQEFYLVEEFIAGHALSAELQPSKRWTETQVVLMLQDVLGILEFVHSHGLIHRDIKPSNLIRRQQDGRLVLIDFGSVKQVWTEVVTTQGKTNATTVIGIPATIAFGTPGYTPTEQLRGRPRPNSDIYALGMMAIQALTGLNPTRLLEDSTTGEIIWQHQNQVSLELAYVLNNMVRSHFKDRYQSVTEVLQALQPVINRYSSKQQKTLFGQRALQLEASIGLLVANKVVPPAASCQEDTMSFPIGDSSEKLSINHSSAVSPPTSSNNFTLLLGVSIGIVSAFALVVGLYCILQLAAPTAPVPQVTSET